MLAYLTAAALLLLAARSAAQVPITVSLPNVAVSLTNTNNNQGERLTLSSKVHEMSLTCRINSSASILGQYLNVTWRKVSDFANVSMTDSRTPIKNTIDSNGLSATSVLTIKYPKKSDITMYVCTVNGSNATGGFISAPLLTMTANGVEEYDTSPWPGQSMVITCLVEGYPVGNVRWSKRLNAAFNVTNNNTIYINAVNYDTDRDDITCTSVNSEGVNSATMFLRVKNPTSYLAPLVATIVELLLMAAICTGYELYDLKRRLRRVTDGAKSN